MSTKNLKRVFLALLLCVTAVSQASTAQSTAAAPTPQQASALLQAQNWGEAAKAFEVITKAEPSNVQAWAGLGWSLLSLDRNAEAAGAFQKALALAQRPRVMYGLASAYAKLNEKDKAFEWLNKALGAHLPQPRQIAGDPNLAGLRDDARFRDVLAAAEKEAKVCMNIPEYRQFDFWVGEWAVMLPGGQQAGANTVRLLEDGCIVEENWTSARGGQTGKSYNFYNPVTRRWHQSYMGNDGGNWMMDGEFKDGAMRYAGAIYSPVGKTLVRMTFFNLGPDQVRQMAETSNDEGKTWAVTWDSTYVRKK